MALVANPLPVDTMTVGKQVVYFDPTADLAGMKFGKVKSVVWNTTPSTAVPLTVTVTPDAGGADVVGAAAFFRVVDNFVPPPAKRPNV